MNRLSSRPNIFETNIFYLILGLVFIGLGSYVQHKDIYIGLIITEYLIILLPTVLYLVVRGYNLKETLRLNKLSIKQTLMIPLIVILIYPVGMFMNSLMMIIISFLGEIQPPPIPVPDTGLELLISLFVIAISAGICEEVMFRGLVMKAYEGLGVKKAIIISAILFGIFHFNIQNLLGPIFLGLVFGYIVYKTNSIFASILAHITNNAIATLLNYFIRNSVNMNPQVNNELVQNIPYPLIMTMGAISIGAVAVVTGLIAFFLIKALPQSRNSILNKAREDVQETNIEKLTLKKAVPLFVMGLIYIGMSVLYISSI
ncbi:type II CAAX endopeptidase family protein [Caldisalinibacter kiritimatiensis]|uniref:Abortive infection protein n=1 Tax=Caldisalinibacter kiritimatiensis TaxID=1304284 RepID=R1CF15_9FIRM|nr:type II CAAX endopeptidase family protein [Caldisalinibacter kiritimatiensis]EOD00895.1 Abortive infection protein [Caldisalinibacter kiritimatiensis]